MSTPVEQAAVERVARAICDQRWGEDGQVHQPTGWDRETARAVIEALQLTEEWAVSSGERRQFDNFGGDRDAAERGLYCAVTNNEHWQEKGREIPLWARNPRIERRLVGPWRTAEENQ